MEALLSLHFQKEEAVYLEMLDTYAIPGELERLLKMVHGSLAAH